MAAGQHFTGVLGLIINSGTYSNFLPPLGAGLGWAGQRQDLRQAAASAGAGTWLRRQGDVFRVWPVLLGLTELHQGQGSRGYLLGEQRAGGG